MAQSVELLLDERAETAIRTQWLRLHEAGLPSEHRPVRVGSHRPHLTVFAGPEIPGPEITLASLVRPLVGLTLMIGSVLLFGPHRGRLVVVRQVLPAAELLALQQQVAAWCGAEVGGQFEAGRWAPHLTLARRARVEDLPAMLTLLPSEPQEATVVGVRRWDGSARRDWLLSGVSS